MVHAGFPKSVTKKSLTEVNRKIKKALKSEMKSRKFARRSIVVKKNINKNQIIKSSDIIALRPNIGISVEKWDEVVGKKAIRNLKKDHTLSMKDLF